MDRVPEDPADIAAPDTALNKFGASGQGVAETWTGDTLKNIPPPCWIGRDLPPIHIEGEEYFLVSLHGDLFLLPNRCPHRGGPLKFGFVNEKDEIVCPMHHNAFSIERLSARKGALRLKVEPR